MKRIFIFVLVSGVLGWGVGSVLHSLPTKDLVHTAMAAAIEKGKAKQLIRHPGENTIEVAVNDTESSSGLPQEILDARAKGATARQRALRQAIGQVFPKSGQWGMGGPLFPTERVVPAPLQRPIRTVFFTPTIPDPYGGPVPPGVWPFGPGNPYLPPHIVHIETFPPPGPRPPPPVVPEPATWLLMVLGFALLALRLRSGAASAPRSRRPRISQS
jgi:hypothetical protein